MFKNFYNTLVSNNGLRAVFIVIFVATMLTIYELIMFYFVVVPKVNTQINDSLSEISKQIKNVKLLDRNFDVNLGIDFDINTINQNKQKLENIIYNLKKMDTTNNYSFLFEYLDKYKNFKNENIDWISLNSFKNIFKTFKEREDRYIEKINKYTVYTSFLLLTILFILLLIIKNKLNSRGENIGTCVWVLSFITLFLIMIFQYSFYIFGNRYNYLGSEGNEEFIYYLLNKL